MEGGILEEYICSIFLYGRRWVVNNITGYLGRVEGVGEGHHKGSPLPPVPAKPNILYSSGRFVDMVCWTVVSPFVLCVSTYLLYCVSLYSLYEMV